MTRLYAVCRAALSSNSTYSICCRFVVQQAVQQIYRLQQIHNISTCRDVVQQMESLQRVHNKSTTNRIDGV